MIEFRWVGRQLQFRERGFQVDASTHFCGVTEFGPWQSVQEEEVGEQELIDRDHAEETADTLASMVLGEPINWSDHDDAWKRAIEKLADA